MFDSPVILLVVFPLVAYVIGSTPFGVIIARCYDVDILSVGSGNVGATNVGRVIGRKWGYLCFALDVLKGLAPTAAVGLLLRTGSEVPSYLHQASWLATGCGAIAGHVFSFYLKFRGGKGVATSLGVVLGVWPYFTYVGLAVLGLWIVVTLISRYVSLASIIAAAAFVPLFAAFNWGELAKLWPMGAFAGVMTALIIVRHRGNIRRLLKGTENKIRRSKG